MMRGHLFPSFMYLSLRSKFIDLESCSSTAFLNIRNLKFDFSEFIGRCKIKKPIFIFVDPTQTSDSLEIEKHDGDQPVQFTLENTSCLSLSREVAAPR